MERSKMDLGRTWDGRDVNEIVKRWMREGSKRYKLRTVIAIGSRVEGRAKPWSDLDVVVIVEKPQRGEINWRDFRVEGCLIIEPRIYDEKEFLNALENLDLSALEAMHHGLVLFDDGFYEKARRVYEKVVREWELKRTEIGWLSLRRLRESSYKK